MKLLSFILNLPWTLTGVLCALISFPKNIEINKKPFAFVLTVRSFWWYVLLTKSKGVRAMALGNSVLLGPHIFLKDLEHELIHVKQAEREPFIFIFLYYIELFKHGYRKNKYEDEAYSTTGSIYIERKEAKPVLFIDFDGTLCHDRFWRSLPPEILEKIKIFEFDENKVAERWMKGEFTSEEINQQIAESIGMEYEKLWETFVDNCSTMSVSQDTLNKLLDLREKYYLVLITDNMDSLDRFTIPSLGLAEYFDAIVNSYNERAGKNDENGKSFLKVVERLGSDITKSFLIDNSKSACKTFEALGGKSFLATSTENLDFWLSKI